MLKVIPFVLLAFFTSPLFAQDVNAGKAAQLSTQPENVVLRVNGDAITQQDIAVFQAALNEQMSGQRISQQMVVSELVKLTVLHQEAQRKELDSRSDVVDAIEQYKKGLLSSVLIQDLGQEMVPSEDEIRKAYQQQLLLIPNDEYRVSYLVAKDKTTAENVIKSLDKQESFGDLAEEFSIDPSKSFGGDLDWTNALQLDQKLMAVIEALKPGEHSKEPLQNDQGWQVVRLREKRKTQKPQYEQVQQGLAEQILTKKIEDYVAQLVDKADVTYVE